MPAGGPPTRTQELGSILYQALAEPVGLLVRTEDAVRGQNALNNAKRRIKDPALMGLQVRVVEHPEGNLAITHGQLGPEEMGL